MTESTQCVSAFTYDGNFTYDTSLALPLKDKDNVSICAVHNGLYAQHIWRRVIMSVLLILVTCAQGSVFDRGTVFATPSYMPESPMNVNSQGMLQYIHQNISWVETNCTHRVLTVHYDCTRVQVPLDYAHPEGGKASIFLLRVKSRAEHKATVFINPGGPGASGAQYVEDMSKQWERSALTQHLDIIGFDPRGIGRTQPVIRCFTDHERDAIRLKTGFASQNPDVLAQKCLQHSGKNVLAHVNTVDVARDLEIIRQAMGLDNINYIGKSYGTYLGEQYIRQFPAHVGSFVFDGVIDPSASSTENMERQKKAFTDALTEFSLYCTHRVWHCPIGNIFTSSQDVGTHLTELINSIKTKHITTSDGRGLSLADGYIGLHTAMYTQQLWDTLVQGLRELQQGKGDTLLHLADAYYARDLSGHYENLVDANIAITCNDVPPAANNYICQHWLVGYVSTPQALHGNNIPTPVVVSATGDPATPYQAGVTLAQQLHAPLITLQGNQHAATLSGNLCIDIPIIEYLEKHKVPTSRTCH